MVLLDSMNVHMTKSMDDEYYSIVFIDTGALFIRLHGTEDTHKMALNNNEV